MKKLLITAVLIGIAAFSIAQPASAQTIPNVKGLTPFTGATNYLSLPGYLRWQYFMENKVWISVKEATQLATSQTAGGLIARPCLEGISPCIFLAHVSGRCRLKVVPLPTLLSTVMRPSCASMISRTIASPSPVPPGFDPFPAR